jgi:hypothetical protein
MRNPYSIGTNQPAITGLTRRKTARKLMTDKEAGVMGPVR